MKLPPLNALKAFEVAARRGSFKLAAEELGVTAAAVSQQVRNLEHYLGKSLFNRSNNRIALTGTGIAIFSDVSSAMGSIASMTERFAGPNQRARLSISVIPALAEPWLAPRLAEFARSNPGVSVEIRVEDDPVELMRDDLDVRLTYGDHLYPQHQTTPLFRDSATPMHAPGFATMYGGDIDLLKIPDEHLIHVVWGENIANYPDWSLWFEAAGIARTPDINRGIRVYNATLAITLAARGMGVALGQLELAKQSVASGALLTPSSVKLSLPQKYCAVFIGRRETYTPLQNLLNSFHDG